MAEKIKLSATGKKVVQLINQTVSEIYHDAVDIKNETWFPEQKNKPVNDTVFRSKIANESNLILQQMQANMPEEDRENVTAVTQELLKQYGDSYTQIYQNNGYRRGFTADYQYDSDPYNQQIGTSRVGILSTPIYTNFIDGRQMNKNVSGYAATNNTYSMCDIVCSIDIESIGGEHVYANLGKLQTLSYSIYQQKQPVRCLGNMNAKDYVYGQRTIAGSLVFAVFNRHWLVDIYDELVNKGMMKNWHYVADEIPPFNITVSFANEYGYDSKMALYGVRLMTEGQVMSINDIYIENTYQFVAMDIEYMDALNAWQTTDKIGRRWKDTAGTIASGYKGAPRQTPNLIGTTPQEDAGTGGVTKPSGNIWIYTDAELAAMKEAEALAKLKQAFETQQKAFQEALQQAKTEGNTEQISEYTKALEQLSNTYKEDYKYIQNYYAKAKVEKATA